jgi:hypothetical protein
MKSACLSCESKIGFFTLFMNSPTKPIKCKKCGYQMKRSSVANTLVVLASIVGAFSLMLLINNTSLVLLVTAAVSLTTSIVVSVSAPLGPWPFKTEP